MAIYLDHAATTPMLPEAIDAYVRAMGVVGNPASVHSQGQNAKRMLEEAREQVAASLGCDPIEVVFTGGGTEAINLGIKGLFWARQPRTRILVPGGEHHATMDTVEWLERHEGAVVEWLPLDAVGRIDLSAVAQSIAANPDDIALVTCLSANNEVGTLQPVAEVAALAAAYGIPVHVDAVAAYGHVPIDFHALSQAGVAALSVSAHKIGGPVGIGALALARRATVEPLLHGGGQQRQVRSGTQDVAAAVAFAVAANALHDLQAENARISALRERLVVGVSAAVPSAVVNGDPDPQNHLPGTAHFSFPGCEGDSLLFLLDVAGISVSTGSACQAGVPEPSHVLRAMGRSEVEARGALRITLGRTNTEADVDALLAALPAAHARAARAGLADRMPGR
ncbi:cysteine desulfurase [Cryobacterium sp. TMT2-18-3]|uniref:cysteine desulfurase family protein n=1 Tax=unclassified Cryobacterium TaxID=2649013 RepID=UPI00106A7C90|nr:MULTISPECIES: cysteine desulfurase family protein [unclassified Cryobacterium]TFC28934.1 cysteine desulfurase [Cryobacterium sp. TMT2-18-2]TFC38418.1 cysteine desulfurase [Cryobacterium sp. TMT2-42-4]TFC61017.1 cysteine desulfurase [Cryobacterium sp. TMT2-18-3]